MARKMESQPEWVQEAVRQINYQCESLKRSSVRHLKQIEQYSEDNQLLLDLLRNLRPDLFNLWNTGTTLQALVEMTKQ